MLLNMNRINRLKALNQDLNMQHLPDKEKDLEITDYNNY